ncbi:MAG TPA: 50S ribosomal protein L35 [Candidatus Saccharimonadales bacterium]|nr:50S ribosomal protein L35 [Candidatus Saccharimonadales bacterium]
MPKIKTHKSLTKRIQVSGSGKLVARHMSIAHRSRFKSKRAKQNSAQNFVVAKGAASKLRKMAI